MRRIPDHFVHANNLRPNHDDFILQGVSDVERKQGILEAIRVAQAVVFHKCRDRNFRFYCSKRDNGQADPVPS
jgi:hypothetical protein